MRESIAKVLHCPRNGFPRRQGCPFGPADSGLEKEEIEFIVGSNEWMKLRHKNRFQTTVVTSLVLSQKGCVSYGFQQFSEHKVTSRSIADPSADPAMRTLLEFAIFLRHNE